MTYTSEKNITFAAINILYNQNSICMEEQEIKNDLDFYRIKTEWTKELDTGALEKAKTEELVMASSYTEAEKVAYAIAEDQVRTHYGSINVEIIKTKINDVLFNDIFVQDERTTCGLICNFFEDSEESGVGLYMVKVVIFTVDEKTGKTRRSAQTVFTPATSNADAAKRIEGLMNEGANDFVIRDTKFDKAEAIYWPASVQQQKVARFDKC